MLDCSDSEKSQEALWLGSTESWVNTRLRLSLPLTFPATNHEVGGGRIAPQKKRMLLLKRQRAPGRNEAERVPKSAIEALQHFPGGSVVKNLPAKAGDLGWISGLGWSPGEGNGYPLQCSCLENPMDREAWWATVHGVRKSQTGLSN